MATKYMHLAGDVTAWFKKHELITGWSLCGTRMNAANMPQRPDAPTCPECARKNGGDPR